VKRRGYIESVLEPMVDDEDGFFRVPLHMFLFASEKKVLPTKIRYPIILPKKSFDTDDGSEMLEWRKNAAFTNTATYKEPLEDETWKSMDRKSSF
jgi:hypothetical protein